MENKKKMKQTDRSYSLQIPGILLGLVHQGGEVIVPKNNERNAYMQDKA